MRKKASEVSKSTKVIFLITLVISTAIGLVVKVGDRESLTLAQRVLAVMFCLAVTNVAAAPIYGIAHVIRVFERNRKRPVAKDCTNVRPFIKKQVKPAKEMPSAIDAKPPPKKKPKRKLPRNTGDITKLTNYSTYSNFHYDLDNFEEMQREKAKEYEVWKRNVEDYNRRHNLESFSGSGEEEAAQCDSTKPDEPEPDVNLPDFEEVRAPWMVRVYQLEEELERIAKQLEMERDEKQKLQQQLEENCDCDSCEQ